MNLLKIFYGCFNNKPIFKKNRTPFALVRRRSKLQLIMKILPVYS